LIRGRYALLQKKARLETLDSTREISGPQEEIWSQKKWYAVGKMVIVPTGVACYEKNGRDLPNLREKSMS